VDTHGDMMTPREPGDTHEKAAGTPMGMWEHHKNMGTPMGTWEYHKNMGTPKQQQGDTTRRPMETPQE